MSKNNRVNCFMSALCSNIKGYCNNHRVLGGIPNEMKRKLVARMLCIVVLCLTLFCSCGTQPEQNIKEKVQDTPKLSDVSNIYDLPLFDDLPETYSDIDPAFWVAESKNGGKVYILGSIHSADKTAYLMPQKIMDAYLKSDALAVEMDIVAYSADESAQQAAEKQTTYTNGDTIQNHIDSDIYLQMVNFIQDNTKDPQLIASLENRKPCIWLSKLADIEGDAGGHSPELGIDRHFLKLAHAQGKKIIEIESATSQYDALNRVSDKAYELLFSQYIYQTPEQLGDSLRNTYDLWKSGQIQGSIEFSDDYTSETEGLSDYVAALAEYMRIIITDRNDVMAKKVKSFLDAGQNVFCVVGADHLPGSTGVIERLKADGYSITQLGGMETTQK